MKGIATKMRTLVTLLAVVAMGVTAIWAEESKAKELERVNAAQKVLSEVLATPDKGIPEEILSGAHCVAVVPSMLNGGFVVGARYGRGIATCRTAAHNWSAPAPIQIEGGSWGLQIGGEAIDLVMLIMNQHGMQSLLSSKFKVGADASAAAGPIGRNVSGDTDWKMRAEVLTYSRARGAFAGITLNGAVIKQDTDDTLALYGKDVSFENILNGKVPAPQGTKPFLTEVAKDFHEAKAAEGEHAQTAGGTAGTTTGMHKSSHQTTDNTGSVAGNTQAQDSNMTQSGTTGITGSPDRVQTNIQNAL